MTNYAYTISTSFSGTFNFMTFNREIKDSSVTGFAHIFRAGDAVTVTADAAQTAAIDTLVAAHDGYAIDFNQNYLEQEYIGKKLTKETWYAKKIAENTYLYPVVQREYTYKVTTLLDETEKEFDVYGSIVRTVRWKYTTEKVGKIEYIRKEKV